MDVAAPLWFKLRTVDTEQLTYDLSIKPGDVR